MTAIDPRAIQLAESRYSNGHGPTLAEPWGELLPATREFLVNEATGWLRAAVDAGLMPPAQDVTAIADADNPTYLRWGLNDVLWGADDSVIVLMSGPDREPYWLELDTERAAVLREDLAGPEGRSG